MTLVFEYLSNGWLDQRRYTNRRDPKTDGDTVVFNDDMMEKQLVWRLKQCEGFAVSPLNWLSLRTTHGGIFGTDAGSRKIVLSPRRHSYPNVPESGFGE